MARATTSQPPRHDRGVADRLSSSRAKKGVSESDAVATSLSAINPSCPVTVCDGFCRTGPPGSGSPRRCARRGATGAHAKDDTRRRPPRARLVPGGSVTEPARPPGAVRERSTPASVKRLVDVPAWWVNRLLTPETTLGAPGAVAEATDGADAGPGIAVPVLAPAGTTAVTVSARPLTTPPLAGVSTTPVEPPPEAGETVVTAAGPEGATTGAGVTAATTATEAAGGGATVRGGNSVIGST